MTRTQLVTLVANRLGDASSAFTTILDTYFDRVLEEMAAMEAIKSLHKVNTTQFTASTSTYSTRTLTGLSSPDFPVDIKRLVVPAWGPISGILTRLNEDQFLEKRLSHINSDGTYQEGQPQYWCLSPNEQQLYVTPRPSSDYVTSNQLEVYYISPPTAIGSGTDITEVRREHLMTIIYGMIAHGASFQDETLPDQREARALFDRAMLQMKGLVNRDHGRDHRIQYRDL